MELDLQLGRVRIDSTMERRALDDWRFWKTATSEVCQLADDALNIGRQMIRGIAEAIPLYGQKPIYADGGDNRRSTGAMDREDERLRRDDEYCGEKTRYQRSKTTLDRHPGRSE